MNIFAYGSLTVPEVMRAATGHHFLHEEAALKGYARYALEGVSYPGIVPEETAEIRGVIYFDIDRRSLERLDGFEGEWYRRTPVEVLAAGRGLTPAGTYVIAPAHRHRLSRRAWDLQKFLEQDLGRFLDQYDGFSRIATDR